ncbi:hypothetical protein QJS66_23285 (plasmid) [Kocuria rhizophila]|nr:hypothetical protein QJS66_23285 [Kocuria rhizophila]
MEVTAAKVTVSTDTARLTYPARAGGDDPQVELMADALEKVARAVARRSDGDDADFLADFAKVRGGGYPQD